MTEINIPLRQITPRDVAGILFRHRAAIVVCYALIVGGVGAYCFFWPPSYEASVRYLVKNDRLEPLITADQALRTVTRHDVTEADLNSEMAIMQSAAVVEQTVSDLKLEHLPEHWAIRLLTWPLERANALYNSYHGRPGESALGRAAGRVARRLSVEPQKKSSVILVRFRWGHPRAAEQILEQHSKNYLSHHQAVRRTPDAQAFFRQQVEEKRHELQRLDAEIAAVRPGATSSWIATDRDLAARQAAEFEAEWRKARALEAQTSARLEGVQKQLAPLPEHVTLQKRTIISAEALETLKVKVLDLRLRRTDLLQKFQPTHREVAQLEEQLRQAEQMLAEEERRSYVEDTEGRNTLAVTLTQDLLTTRSDLDALGALRTATEREGRAFKAQVVQFEQQAERLRTLERERKSVEESYLEYVQRFEEARINEQMHRTRFVNVAVIEPVRAGASPVKPRVGLLMKLALGLGLVVSLALAFALDFIDRRVKHDRDLEMATGVPVLTAFDYYPHSVTRASGRAVRRGA